MKKILVIFMLLISIQVSAQEKVWVKNLNQKPFIVHTITNNQTIFSLSRMYHIPLAEIANVNNELYKKGFSNGDTIYIPINKANYLTEGVEGNSIPLYYTVTNNETLIILSRRMAVRQSMLQTWNDLADPNVKNGQTIILGWVKYTPQNTGKVFKSQPLQDAPLTAEAPTIPEFQEAYDNINADEQQENGLIVFYDVNTNLKQHVYYAFHNTLTKGSIVKVTNPLNGVSVYAKIIGKIPNLDHYQKAKLVLSNNATATLEAHGSEFFCNIFSK
jgi:LysM repeat protein